MRHGTPVQEKKESARTPLDVIYPLNHGHGVKKVNDVSHIDYSITTKLHEMKQLCNLKEITKQSTWK